MTLVRTTLVEQGCVQSHCRLTPVFGGCLTTGDPGVSRGSRLSGPNLSGLGVCNILWERGHLHSVPKTTTDPLCLLRGDKARSCLSSMKPAPVSLFKESGNFIHLLKSLSIYWPREEGVGIGLLVLLATFIEGVWKSLESQDSIISITPSYRIARRTRFTPIVKIL